ncbi:MAG: urea ABC transporter permease subunit UrtB [Aquabacterium sp.]|uniref:urea ABC transporter permease subunit UrtB n=1 Tax=Aquabacterium sp. TaxID=1872578 RepID=UPI0025C02C74|nr:urea ABC transporter permease subunit UrtB [Aquabacterium sp.]MBI3383913.1 urea ABC transporter permease subunit UrtB [Aquabacterium sp.]
MSVTPLHAETKPAITSRAGRALSASLLTLSLTLALAFAVGPRDVHALTADEAYALSAGDNDARIATLQKLVAKGDPALPAFLDALAADTVKVAGNKAYIVYGDEVKDAATGAPAKLPDGAEDVVNNNRMSSEIEAALGAGKLLSKDVATRAEAIDSLSKAADESKLPLIDKALAAETDPKLKTLLKAVRAKAMLSSSDAGTRIAATKALAEDATPEARALLMERMADGSETDSAVKGSLQLALDKVNRKLAWGEYAGVLFTGISLGSILLLAALGLAITYGLMGVINMAHGELMMIGAYATFAVQNVFRNHFPGAFDWYIVLAVPASFLAAAAVGAVLERGVFRFLYGRPLETLLASWGVSLVLMQGVRSLFGAQNVQVENPAWMSGGFDILSNLTLPYNRLVIIAFAGVVLLAMTLLIAKTRMGLFVRSVTQNRPMASCMGVNTARVDTMAFSLGAGIAGLAGCALSQIGNVGPDLGQNYIVDSFMVVVLGGVGQIAGTVYAAMGLGLINKFLEGWAGAVLAKIMVLVIVVIFIQKRPQGLFAMKGRSAEA